MIVESSQGPPECEPGGVLRARSASDRSVDYSRPQSSCGSLPSGCDYSEDFVSDFSGPTLDRSSLEAGVRCQKTSKAKGLKGPSAGTPLEWQAPLLNSQRGMVTQRREAVAHRVLSARLRKIRELRSELADVARELEAAVLENRFLKQAQARHLRALGGYESAQGHLPQLVAKHQSEVKTLRQLLRRSQGREREAVRRLRETDQELLRARAALHTLQQLTQDRGLAEREELAQRLCAHMARLEANDRKIQRLEKQLRLNTKSFSQQLATENQKTLTAQTTNRTLQAEMKRLQQRLKEKGRELEIRNIYTNRILKNLSEPQDDLRAASTKATQVDRRSFSLVPLKHQETQKSCDPPAGKGRRGRAPPLQARRKAGSTVAREKAATGACPSPPSGSQEDPKSKHHGDRAASTDRPAEAREAARAPEPAEAEVQAALDGARSRAEETKQAEPVTGAAAVAVTATAAAAATAAATGTPEPQPPPKGALGEKVEDKKKEEGKEPPPGDPQVRRCGRRRNRATPEPAPEPPAAPPGSRFPARPRKRYSFPEVVENLHQGLPAGGAGAGLGLGHAHGHGHGHASGRPRPRPDPGPYEPSFGRARAQDSAFRERKSSLMEELFGGPRRDPPPAGQASANNAFGDSRATVPNSVPSPPPLEGKRKIII